MNPYLPGHPKYQAYVDARKAETSEKRAEAGKRGALVRKQSNWPSYKTLGTTDGRSDLQRRGYMYDKLGFDPSKTIIVVDLNFIHRSYNTETQKKGSVCTLLDPAQVDKYLFVCKRTKKDITETFLMQILPTILRKQLHEKRGVLSKETCYKIMELLNA